MEGNQGSQTPNAPMQTTPQSQDLQSNPQIVQNAALSQENQVATSTPPTETTNVKKKSIPWQIKVGIIVPVLFFLITLIFFIIKTQGFKTGSYSVTINGASNPTLVQVQTLLKNVYPKSNINLLWSTSKNLQTSEGENILTVMIEMDGKLTPEERKNLAVQICNIYSSNNQQLDNLVIWSSLPKILGFFPAESLDKQSVESRACTDWVGQPAKI